MLGETVLQMTIATGDKDQGVAFASNVFSSHACIILSAFIIAWCMMISFRLMISSQLAGFTKTNSAVGSTQAEENELMNKIKKGGKGSQARFSLQSLGCRAKEIDKLQSKETDDKHYIADPVKTFHMMMTARENNVGQELLWELLAVSVMLEGVGVKLALYDPEASPTAHFAFQQRIQLSLPITMVYGTVMLHQILFRDWHHYDWRFRWVRRSTGHAMLLVARLGLLATIMAVSLVELQPMSYVPLLAGLTLASTLLLHLHDSFKVESDNAHPMTGIAQVLNGMRIRARKGRARARGVDVESMDASEESCVLSPMTKTMKQGAQTQVGQAMTSSFAETSKAVERVGAMCPMAQQTASVTASVLAAGASTFVTVAGKASGELAGALADPNSHDHGHDDGHDHGHNGGHDSHAY